MSIGSKEDQASYLASLDCVHCGLCLEHCPTYRVTGRESANPRGRVYLMRGLLEDTVQPTQDVTDELDLCLVCRACETACPSGVRFGELMASTRERTRPRGRIRRRMMKLLTSRKGLNRFAGLMRFYQKSGLRVFRHVLPGRLKRMEAYLPQIPDGAERAPLPLGSPAIGREQGTVALFAGCVAQVLFQDVNQDTISLLTHAGYNVLCPEDQACCGALHEHDGDLATTRDLLRRNVSAFGLPEITAVISNASGCGAGLKQAPHLLGGEDASQLADRVVDVARFLVDHGHLLEFNRCDSTVTYDAPCHLHHAQCETEGPLPLLQRIPGLRLEPLPDADRCCGAAGIYNLDQPEMSEAILDAKLDALAITGAEILLTGNPGCILQWRGGIARRGLGVRVLHPVTFLANQLKS